MFNNLDKGRQVGESGTSLVARNVFQILNETFTVYGKYPWRLMGMVAIVQIPISVIAWIIYGAFGGNEVVFVVVVGLGLFGFVLTYGVVVFALCQHYVVGTINAGECFRRMWWRIVSLCIIAAVMTPISYAIIGAPADAANAAVAVVLVMLILPAIVILVYWSLSIPAVIVEKRKAFDALGRSFRLIKGNWWRVFGITLLVGLVALGLSLLVSIPFALIGNVSTFAESETAAMVIQASGSIAVEVVVLPVLYISSTLVYYDLRVRKEEFDIDGLSHDMGIIPIMPPSTVR